LKLIVVLAMIEHQPCYNIAEKRYYLQKEYTNTKRITKFVGKCTDDENTNIYYKKTRRMHPQTKITAHSINATVY
jgi:hypothetical protein